MERDPSQRKRGLLLILGGLAVGGALFVALIALSKAGIIKPDVSERIQHGVVVRREKYSLLWGIPAVVPLFTTLIGLVQIVTGRSFRKLGESYETMSGGKKFLVSVLVLGLALGVIFGFIAIAFAIML